MKSPSWKDLIRCAKSQTARFVDLNEMKSPSWNNTRVAAIESLADRTKQENSNEGADGNNRNAGLTVCRLCSWACRGRKSPPWRTESALPPLLRGALPRFPRLLRRRWRASVGVVSLAPRLHRVAESWQDIWAVSGYRVERAGLAENPNAGTEYTRLARRGTVR
jgi:hypothetical protein